MIWLPLLKRFGPALAIFVVFVAAYGGFRNAVSSAYQKGYKAAEASMAKRVAEANAITAEREASARRLSDAASTAWEQKRADLETQIGGLLSRPRPAVRLCVEPASGGKVPGDSTSAGRIDDSTERIEPAVRAGDDLGPALALYAATCEADRLKLLDLQDWITQQSAAATPPASSK